MLRNSFLIIAKHAKFVNPNLTTFRSQQLTPFTSTTYKPHRTTQRGFRASHKSFNSSQNPTTGGGDADRSGLQKLPNNQKQLVNKTFREEVTSPFSVETNTDLYKKPLVERALDKYGHEQRHVNPNLLKQDAFEETLDAQEVLARQQAASIQRFAQTLTASEAQSASSTAQPNAALQPIIQAKTREPMSLEEYKKEQARVQRGLMGRKLLGMACFLTICVGSSTAYFKQHGVFGFEEKAEEDYTTLDYTTRRISNAENSVSPLAQEIIEDIINALKTPEDHAKYNEETLPLNPILDPKEALELPMLIAYRPSLTQQQHAEARHQQEMRKVYQTPPLNNHTINLFLTEEEQMERAFRLSHDEKHVMASDKPRDVGHLGDQIRFQLGIGRF